MLPQNSAYCIPCHTCNSLTRQTDNPGDAGCSTKHKTAGARLVTLTASPLLDEPHRPHPCNTTPMGTPSSAPACTCCTRTGTCRPVRSPAVPAAPVHGRTPAQLATAAELARRWPAAPRQGGRPLRQQLTGGCRPAACPSARSTPPCCACCGQGAGRCWGLW